MGDSTSKEALKLRILPSLLERDWKVWSGLGTGSLSASEHCLLIRRFARDAVVVHAQNIYDWLKGHGDGFCMTPVIPNLSPPFKSMFFEMSMAWEGRTFTRGILLMWVRAEEGASTWTCTNWKHAYDLRFIDFTEENGNIVELAAGKFGLDSGFNVMTYAKGGSCPESPSISWALGTALSSVSFFHCKNISTREVQSPCKHPRKFRRFHGYDPIKFHVIDIHKGQKTSRPHSAGEIAQAREARAAFVRGHFKKYSGDTKLFGKHEGVWWWPLHVRGNGEPEKPEYRVWPPAGDHADACIVKE